MQIIKSVKTVVKTLPFQIALILMSFMLINGTPFFFGDAYGYFHTTKTLTTELQFNTDNVPPYALHAGHGVVYRDDGKKISVYPPGISLLWTPFFLVSNQFDHGTIYTDYFKAFNGHSFADGFAVLIAANFYTYLAIILLLKLLKQKGYSTRNSLIAIAFGYISTYAIYYLTQQPGYSHVYEVFSLSLFLYLLEKFNHNNGQSNKLAVLIGVAAGLVVAIRLTNFMVFIPMFIVMFKYWKKLPLFFVGALPFLIYLFTYNYVNFGGILSNGYQAMWGQTFDFTNPHLFELIFSDFRGILIWSPAIILALIGLWKNTFIQNNKWNIFVYSLPTFFVIIPYVFWPWWYAGDSIGQRFIIIALAFLVFGFANILADIKSKRSKIIKSILWILILYSLLIFALHRITPTDKLIQADSEKAIFYWETQNIPTTDLASPYDIFQYHFQTFADKKSIADYLQKLANGFNGGRSLLLIGLDLTDTLIITKPIDDLHFEIYIVPKPQTIFSKQITTDINILIEGQTHYIKLNSVALDKNLTISVECSQNGCIPQYDNFELMQFDNITEQIYTPVTKNIKIAITSDAKIKFVNPKLNQSF